MANELLQALLAAQQKPKETGYGMAATGVGASLPGMINPYGSTGANIGIALGGGLLASLLAGAAKRSAAEENLARNALAQQVMAASPTERASLVADQPELQPLLSALQAQEREQAVARATKMEDLALGEASELRKARNKSLLDVGLAQGRIPTAEGELVPLSELGLQDPTEFEIEKKTRASEAAEASLREQQASLLGVPEKVREEEKNWKKEIETLPAVKQFQLMELKLPMLENDARLDSKSSDIAFVFNYIKSLDDGAVRGEEIDLANTANPLLQRWGQLLKGSITGESELTSELKQQMLAELKATRGAVYSAAKDQADFKIGQVQKLLPGVRKEALLPFDWNLTFEGAGETPARLSNAPAVPSVFTARDGRQIELID